MTKAGFLEVENKDYESQTAGKEISIWARSSKLRYLRCRAFPVSDENLG